MKCNICNYKWLPRKEKPLACPKCKRYDYDKPKEEDKQNDRKDE